MQGTARDRMVPVRQYLVWPPLLVPNFHSVVTFRCLASFKAALAARAATDIKISLKKMGGGRKNLWCRGSCN